MNPDTVKPTSVFLTAVDAQGKERTDDDAPDLPHGRVMHVPAVGDVLQVEGREWLVLRRAWTVPFPHPGAVRPAQQVVLFVYSRETD